MPTCSAYSKSKTLAEQAAWDFLKNLPENEKFALSTINPGLIVGPNLNTAKFTSGDIIKKVMMGEFPGMPRVIMSCVEVRDVARAHLEAVMRDEANN